MGQETIREAKKILNLSTLFASVNFKLFPNAVNELGNYFAVGISRCL